TGTFSTRNYSPIMRLQTLKEARWILLVLLLLGLASLWISLWLFLIVLILIVYTFAFFRDPERAVPSDANTVVAAADGVVTDIVEIEETEILKAKTRRV